MYQRPVVKKVRCTQVNSRKVGSQKGDLYLYQFDEIFCYKVHSNFFLKAVDGLQETERSEAKGKLGTTKKGIGPTYSSKATRNGVRISDLMRDFDKFAEKFSSLADCHAVRFKSLQVDKNAELERYKVYAERLEISI